MADSAITVANVLKSSNGQYVTGIAAVTITQGQYLYLTAANTLNLADSNGTSPANSVEGCSLNAALAGQPVTYVRTDTALATGATLTSGAVAYLSDTPGGITVVYGDIASGSTVIVLGVVNTAGTLNFNPQTGGVK